MNVFGAFLSLFFAATSFLGVHSQHLSPVVAPSSAPVVATSTTQAVERPIVPSSTPNVRPVQQVAVAPTSTQSIAVTYTPPEKTGGCTANQALPDHVCSPGAVLTTDTSVICVSGYTKTVRNVPISEKEKVFAEYDIPWSLHSGYEVDHIISLELGGSNDISNLFPESYSIRYGARVKDTFENYLHKQVCSGNLSVTAAQQEISTDWLAYYLAWQNGTATPAPPADAVTATTPVATATTNVTPSDTSAPAYYTSSYGTSKYYYPASCSAWKGLSSKYLTPFPSLQALLLKYPNKTLSPQCP